MRLQDIYTQDLKVSFEDAKKNIDFVKQIQTRLKSVGLYFGNVDGLWGPNTDKAVEEFCKRSFLDNFGSKVIGKTFAEKLIEAKAFQNALSNFVSKLQVEQVFNNKISDASYQDFLNCIETFDITTKPRVRAFLAQCGHESGGGRYTLELASGQAYEGRRDLGNTQPGWGIKYKGSGFLQCTGYANVKAFSDYLAKIGKPDPRVIGEGAKYIANTYPWTVSGHWWHNNGINRMVDNGATCRQVSARVNGKDPSNGLADREMYFARALRFIP